MTLYDYQRECVAAVVDNARNNVTRQLVTLPTGSGKTVCFAHLPKALKVGRALFVAHREELIDHAVKTLAKVNPGVSIGVEMAERRARGDDAFVVASVQSLQGRLGHYAPNSFPLVVVDEAHHAVAPSYRKVLDHLGAMNGSGVVLCGFTATAGRGDGQGLGQVFQKIVFSKSLREMIDAGWLVDIAAWRVRTDASLTGIRMTAGDFAVGQLSKAVNTEARNALIVETHERLARNLKTLVFTVDVQHAHDLADAFRARGVNAEAVDGSMAKRKRRSIIKRFTAGRIDVLANCALLTEGFDCPDIGAILMARPTKSKTLYQQMLGRGTRTAPGKDRLVLIDFVDNSRRNDVINLPTLFGLHPELSCRGRKVAELAGRVERSGVDGANFTDAKELEATIERIHLFRVPELLPEIAAMTRNAWRPVLDGVYRLALPERRALLVTENLLGHCEVWKEKSGERLRVGEYADLGRALHEADKLVPRDCIGAVIRGARWRKQQPTPGQLAVVRKLNIPVPKDATKGDISAMISAYFARGERIQVGGAR